jgi:hypothetical protein
LHLASLLLLLRRIRLVLPWCHGSSAGLLSLSLLHAIVRLALILLATELSCL